MSNWGDMLAKTGGSSLRGWTGSKWKSYGKAAIVGENGELEHAAALLHPKLGTPMRENIGGGKALIPSAKKMGSAGTAIDVPLGHKDAAFVRSHFDAMEVRIPDAPRANEIMLCVVMTNGGRPLPRVGGLTVDQIKRRRRLALKVLADY